MSYQQVSHPLRPLRRLQQREARKPSHPNSLVDALKPSEKSYKKQRRTDGKPMRQQEQRQNLDQDVTLVEEEEAEEMASDVGAGEAGTLAKASANE